MAREDKVRKRLKRDIRDLESSITDMRLDLGKEIDRNGPNTYRARSLTAQIKGDRKKLMQLKETLKALGG